MVVFSGMLCAALVVVAAHDERRATAETLLADLNEL